MKKIKVLITLIKTSMKAKVIAGIVTVAVVGTGAVGTVVIVNHNNEVKQEQTQMALKAKSNKKDNTENISKEEPTKQTEATTSTAATTTSDVKATDTTNSTLTNDTLEKARQAVGSRLAELQKDLSKLGYKVDTNGTFGQTTYDSLVKFQSEHGLTADGLAGSATFAKLNALLYPTTASSGNTGSSSSGGTTTGGSTNTGVTPPAGYTGGITLNSVLTNQFNSIVHENKYTGANYNVLHNDLVSVALGNMTDSQFAAKHFVPGTETGGWTENPDGSSSKFFTHDYKITRFSTTSGDSNTIYQQARANGLFVSVDTVQTYTPFLYAETVIVYNPSSKCNTAVRLIMSFDRLFL